MGKSEGMAFDFSLADESRMQVLKTVVGYEAARRGVSLGHAILALAEQAADVESYPDELKAELAAIDEDAVARAVEQARMAAKLPRTA